MKKLESLDWTKPIASRTASHTNSIDPTGSYRQTASARVPEDGSRAVFTRIATTSLFAEGSATPRIATHQKERFSLLDFLASTPG